MAAFNSRARRWCKGARTLGAIAMLIAAIVIVFGRPGLAAKATEKQLNGRTVTVGVPKHWPPHYSLDQAGRPTGFAVDVIEEIAKSIGIRLTYRIYPDFSALGAAWDRGEIDIVPNSGITPDRQRKVRFTLPIETLAVSVFVRRGNSDITRSDALAGRKVSVVAGNIGHSLLKKRRDVTLVVHPDLQHALFEMLSGKSDALVYPGPVLLKMAQSIGVESRVEALEPPLGQLERGIAVQRHETALHAALNFAAAAFRETPEYDAIYQKWHGAPAPFWSILRVMTAGVALLTALLIAMAWWRYRSIVRLNLRLQESLVERERVDKDLSKAKAQLEDAIEAISEGFVLYDADERLVLCNSKHKELHPIAAHLMVPGQSFEDITRTAAENGQFPAAIGRLDEWVEERLARFRNASEPVLLQLADGRWLRFSERKTRDGGTVGIRTDISQLKRAEEALGESEARFRDLALSASDWFWEMDEQLRFFYFSDRFSDITGVAEADLLGKTRQESGIPNVGQDIWRRHLEDLEAHRPFRDFVHPRINTAGETRWFSINGTPIFDEDGRFKGYRGTGSDITQQKRTDYLLRESEQRLKAIMDGVPTAMFLKDREARYLLINRQFQDWFGVDPVTVIGKNVYDLYPKERADRYAVGDEKILSDWQVTTDEVTIPGPTGEDRFYTLTKFPIFSAGEPAGFGGVMMDITERAQADRALRQSENRAEMANRAKSEFLANMSHELRTPLNAIIGFAEIIKSGAIGSVDSDKTREYAGDIYQSGQHLLDLINDILDISKIELGSEEPNDVEIVVPQLIDSVLVLMKERARQAQVRIETNFHGDAPLLRADERKLKQILINLVSNSIKFTHADGLVTLDVRCRPADGYEFVVSDTGIGIAPDDIAKALQPFGQIDSDLNRKYAGTGLGLPLAKELVEMHDGSLNLQSKSGVGTTVTVRFPANRIVPAVNGESVSSTQYDALN